MYQIQDELPEDRFKLVQRLGFGFFSKTFLVQDNKSKISACCKVITIEKDSEEELKKEKKDIMSCVNRMGKLEYHHVCKLLDHFFIDNIP